MKVWWVTRYGLLAEVLICFGPLVAFYLMAVATLPFSFATILSELSAVSSASRGQVPVWALAAPVILTLGGGCGLFALLAVVQSLRAGSAKLAYSRRAILTMAILGLMTLLGLGVYGGKDAQYADSRLFFFWLPLLSSVHNLFLARNLLFRPCPPQEFDNGL